MSARWLSLLLNKHSIYRPGMRRFTLLLVATLAYAALFAPLQFFWGRWISFLVLAPVAFAGWWFGPWTGAAWGLLCWLFNVLLWQENGLLELDRNISVWALLGLVLFLMCGFIVGWLQERDQHRSDLDRIITPDHLERINLVNTTPGSYETAVGSAVDFIPDPAMAVNREGCIVAWNCPMEILTGIQVKDALGRPARQAGESLYGEVHPMLVDVVLQPNGSYEKQFPGLKKEDGALVVENYLPRLKPGGIYLWSKAAPLYNLDGAMVGAVQILRDVTEIRLLEEKRALAAQRDRLTGLFVLDHFMNEVSRLENAPVYPISILLVKMAPVFISGRSPAAMEEDLLRRAGLAFTATFRASDSMARLGDREFGVLLPRTDASMAQNVAERLRKALAKYAPDRRDVLAEFTVVSITCQEPGTLSETLQQSRSL